MPLIKLFTRDSAALPPVDVYLPRLLEIWNVPAHIMKVLVMNVADWSYSAGESLYIDIRAKATPARTPEAVQAAIKEMVSLFEAHGLTTNIRVELYEPGLQHSHQSGPGSNNADGTCSGPGQSKQSLSASSSRPSTLSAPALRRDWRAAAPIAALRRAAARGREFLHSCEWMTRSNDDLLAGAAFSVLMRACMGSREIQATLLPATHHTPTALLH